MRKLVAVTWRSIRRITRDDAPIFAASVAFYASLSLAPLVALSLWATALLGSDVQQGILDQVQAFFGPQAGRAVEPLVESSEDSPGGGLAGVLGIATVLFGATGVFAQLQTAMNRIWNVEAAPGSGVLGFVRKRLLSLGMIAVFGFLLLVSLVATALLNALAAQAGRAIPGGETLWMLLGELVAIAVYALMFGALFKLLPDVRIAWRDVRLGAIVTALLFAAGKLALGVYLGRAGVGSAYGAAGSLVVLLVWVYYSSMLVFLGAEITQAWAQEHDRPIVPDRHARRRPDASLGTT